MPLEDHAPRRDDGSRAPRGEPADGAATAGTGTRVTHAVVYGIDCDLPSLRRLADVYRSGHIRAGLTLSWRSLIALCTPFPNHLCVRIGDTVLQPYLHGARIEPWSQCLKAGRGKEAIAVRVPISAPRSGTDWMRSLVLQGGPRSTTSYATSILSGSQHGWSCVHDVYSVLRTSEASTLPDRCTLASEYIRRLERAGHAVEHTRLA